MIHLADTSYDLRLTRKRLEEFLDKLGSLWIQYDALAEWQLEKLDPALQRGSSKSTPRTFTR